MPRFNAKTALTPEDIHQLADAMREYASRLDASAKRMLDEKVRSVSVAVDTFQDATLGRVNGFIQSTERAIHSEVLAKKIRHRTTKRRKAKD